MTRPGYCQNVKHGEWTAVPCSRKAVRDGWCAQHHPDAVKARQAQSNARFVAQQAARQQAAIERERSTVRRFLAWYAVHGIKYPGQPLDALNDWPGT